MASLEDVEHWLEGLRNVELSSQVMILEYEITRLIGCLSKFKEQTKQSKTQSNALYIDKDIHEARVKLLELEKDKILVASEQGAEAAAKAKFELTSAYAVC
eukprot:scaffold27511_cov199-Amphora_coffeaeformis.AAC.2